MKAQYPNCDLNILGARLRLARDAAQITQQTAADQIQISRSFLSAIENGERRITEMQLVQLAQFYGVPVAELLLPFLPIAPEQTLLGHFRKAARVDAAVEAELRRQVESIQTLCQEYRQLEQIYGARTPTLHAPDYQIPGTKPGGIATGKAVVTRFAEEAAGAERNRLGLGDAPIKDLFDILEDEEEGLSIFQIDLPSTVSGFFGSDAALGSTVVINRKHPDERRQWSLAHEYAHVLTRRQFPGFQILYTYTESRVPESERFANAFANAFLMPRGSVGRRFERIRDSQGEFQNADISRMAHSFSVSFEAMARRLEELDLIEYGTLDALRDLGYKHVEALDHLGLTPNRLSNRKFPLRHEFLVGMAAAKGLITEEEVMRYLGLDRTAARDRLRLLSHQPFVSDSGKVFMLTIPLVGQGA